MVLPLHMGQIGFIGRIKSSKMHMAGGQYWLLVGSQWRWWATVRFSSPWAFPHSCLGFLANGNWIPSTSILRDKGRGCSSLKIQSQKLYSITSLLLCSLRTELVNGPAQSQGEEKQIPPLTGRRVQSHYRKASQMGDIFAAIFNNKIYYILCNCILPPEFPFS